MTGRTAIATAHWRRLDKEGTDRCTLSRLNNGWMLVGQAIWHDGKADASLTYDIRCEPGWASLSADIGGEVDGQELSLRLHRAEDGWYLNGDLQEGTADCIDLDLSFTPSTNLLPLRRLPLKADQSAPVCAAWLKPDFATIGPLEQTYTSLGPDHVQYVSPAFSAELRVHESGFVTRYPGLWEGWVDA